MPQFPAGETSRRRTLNSLELRCPPLPRTLGDALQLMNNPERMEVGPVTDIVQRDPIVVARLLHTVNSSYYGLRQTVSSADRAVVMLGPVAVAGIVLGMQMLQLRSILEGPAADCFQRIIRHSTATAYLTRFLLDDSTSSLDQRSALGLPFTAGLLHDFGKIILVYNFPTKALQLYDRQVPHVRFTAADKHELERHHFGCDHTEVGEYAARKLSFPDVLVHVIRYHHDADFRPDDPEIRRLVRATAAADKVANAMGYGVALDQGEHTLETLATDPIWERLSTQDLPHSGAPEAVAEAMINQRSELDRFIGLVSDKAA